MEGPWYISVAAVRDYLWITGQPDATDGPAFDQAEMTLIEFSQYAARGKQQPKRLDSGALRYRGPRPRRLMLIVGRGEGSLPALIAVLPGIDDGRGSAPHRQPKSRRS